MEVVAVGMETGKPGEIPEQTESPLEGLELRQNPYEVVQPSLEFKPYPEISSETVRRIRDIPNVLHFIDEQLDVARESWRPPRQQREAIASAGNKSCNSLTELLGDAQLWYVLHTSVETQVSVQWTASLDVPATTNLLMALGSRPPDVVKQRVMNAKTLLEAAITIGSQPSVSSLQLVMAAQQALDELREEICSRTDRMADQLRTAEERRRFMTALGKVSGVLGLWAGVALQVPVVQQAVSEAAPEVKTALGQFGGAVGQTLAVLGPVGIIEQVGAALDILKAPADHFKPPRGVSERKWERVDREPIDSLEDRLHDFQERLGRIEPADIAMVRKRAQKERKRDCLVVGPDNPTGLYIRPVSGLVDSTDRQYVIHSQTSDPTAMGNVDSYVSTEFLIKPSGSIGKEEPERLIQWEIIDDQRKIGSFIASEDLAGRPLVRKEGDPSEPGWVIHPYTHEAGSYTKKSRRFGGPHGKTSI